MRNSTVANNGALISLSSRRIQEKVIDKDKHVHNDMAGAIKTLMSFFSRQKNYHKVITKHIF